MTKKIFGIALIGILASILIVNIIQDAREKKNNAAVNEEFLIENAGDDEYIDAISEGLAEGDIPPDFELTTFDKEKVRLSDYKGKKVILNFWASWCGPCKAEMPHMEKFYQEKAKDLNVEIIAVNLTNSEHGLNKLDKVQKFIHDYGLTFPIPLDETGEVGDTYRTITIPTSYIIDTKGLISKKIMGPMDEEMMEKLVKDID
ncbi:redoxin domain-containing protein [Lederbergia citrea]|uniref:Redoxin domain-containing protein n=1 Tax=Lederbergia citrea TaxID=2833581 RepID=A0A942UQU8_9BACI|nr:redoxin domain-containing protein [Lederbergia citrea]MBS4178321.1 redoxin domain-containing protein [Lederbergia citrea]MBS4204997.1 redoxin domain-containing protein [Lederbergia citrea]MBS4223148.1 redoxin domain-containing protein [Lederbergia citrea]